MPKRPRDGGDQVMRMLDSFGRFSGADDPALAESVFSMVHGHRLEQRLTYGHRQYHARDALLRLDKFAGVTATVPARMLEALFLMDGKLSLAAIAAELATVREEPLDQFLGRLTALAARLHEQGYVEVVETEGPTRDRG